MQSPSVWAMRLGSAELPSPCGYYRIIMAFDELRRHGWDARHMTSDINPPPESEQADVFVMECGNKPEAAQHLRARSAYQACVYEADDDYFNVPATLDDAHAEYGRPETREAIAANMRACAVVTVTTETLAASVRKHTGHPDVRVVPNCLPDGVCDLPTFHRPRRTVIGWTGSGQRGGDFEVVSDAVRTVLETVKRCEMHFMGTDYRNLLPRSLPTRHSHPPPSSTGDLAWFRGFDFDIALAPLRDIPFNRARSEIKALEAFGLGIPVLASDMEPYQEIVIDGVNGYLCRSPKDWAKRLRELACDRQAREEMGRNARKTALAHTITTGWKNWDSVYASLL